jgi:hypothetical protein
LYPQIKGYHYPKYSSIQLQSFDDLEEDDVIYNKYNYNNLEDELTEQFEKTITLLMESKSGHKNFQVEIDAASEEDFDTEPTITDKTPGKVLDHRYWLDELQILMKWKYLSYEDSLWVPYQHYKHMCFSLKITLDFSFIAI